MNEDSNDRVQRTVMLIDDEQDVRETMADFLQENGYHVESAAHGEQALEKLKCIRPRLILLDVTMPHMDGLEVLNLIKQNRNLVDVPVIMLTAKGESQTIMRAQDLGAADFITKPFDVSEFLAAVKKFV